MAKKTTKYNPELKSKVNFESKDLDTNIENNEKKNHSIQNIPVLLLKMFVVAAIVIGVVKFTDYKMYFEPNNLEDHSTTRWNGFYNIKDTVPLDIVFIGSSKVYNGINTYPFSMSLGNICYLIAFTGNPIVASYYDLCDVLDSSDPKLICVDTHGIGNWNIETIDAKNKSFLLRNSYARHGLYNRLRSLHALFRPDDWPSAFSNTIRNHDFIFRDTIQLNKNKKGIFERHQNKQSDNMYLGRFARFTSGITDSVIALYDSLGAPIDGKERVISPAAGEYVGKIIDKCRERNIPILFYTTPLYYRHIKNYEYIHAKIDSVLAPYNVPYYDMQLDYDTLLYDRQCFESTYGWNQHGTLYGSSIISYKLARYIKDSMKVDLPVRDTSEQWKKWFYGKDDYFFNYQPDNEDKKAVVVSVAEGCKDRVLGAYYENMNESNRLIVKVPRTAHPEKKRITIKGTFNGTHVQPKLEINYISNILPAKHDLYMIHLVRSFNIESIEDFESIE